MFWNNLSVPFSDVKQSKKIARKRWSHCCTRDSVCGDWFSMKAKKQVRLLECEFPLGCGCIEKKECNRVKVEKRINERGAVRGDAR